MQKVSNAGGSGSIGSKLQLTLAILKPDLISHHARTRVVKEIIVQNGFLIIHSRVVHFTRTEAEKFYKEHQERFFYNRLVGFMSSGPMKPMILARENAIPFWRQLLGPTKVYRARQEAPDSIRARFGLTDTRNAAHGSDSDESAKREIEFFFPEFDYNHWYNSHEPQLRNNNQLQKKKKQPGNSTVIL